VTGVSRSPFPPFVLGGLSSSISLYPEHELSLLLRDYLNPLMPSPLACRTSL
jgi:hypothetical protein